MPDTPRPSVRSQSPSRPAPSFGQTTSMNAIDHYLSDIARYTLLTKDEEYILSAESVACEEALRAIAAAQANLARLQAEASPGEDRSPEITLAAEKLRRLTRLSESVIETGKAAQKRLVEHNLRFVVSLAKEYRRGSLPLADLIQAGNEGLMHAARKFDKATFHTPFVNYAASWVKQRLQKYTTEHSRAVRVPPYRSAPMQKISRVAAQLMQELERMPTDDEVVVASGYTAEEVSEIMKLIQPDLELDAQIKGDASAGEIGSYFGESVSDADQRETEHLESMTFRAVTAEGLKVLTDRERGLLAMIYGLDGQRERTPTEIAEIMGITRERVRQIKNAAMEKLRESMQDPRVEVD